MSTPYYSDEFRVDWVSVSRFIDATEPVQHDLFGGE